ncbi:MAG: cysteine desulfurase [Proteobacteria bacterium]|nr:cysteine desulfurase [Pseudomonadota bacterium]
MSAVMGDMTRVASARKPSNKTGLERIAADFPILQRRFGDKPLVYLDSAASAQKPNAVIDATATAYRQHYANIHRGLYQLSNEATEAYEACRKRIADFINAPSHDEIVITSGATMGLNIIAHGLGRVVLEKDHEILITIADHHANIVPWQMIANERGAKLVASPINKDGSLDMAEFARHITPQTKIIAIPHVSNVLGTVFDIPAIAKLAKQAGAVLVVDGCQGIVHAPVDVVALGCDFYAFSGHKLYGPSGIGAFWGRGEWLDKMPPFHGGGEMIDRVRISHTTYAPPPYRFEAGTPPIAQAVGLKAAIDYVTDIGMDTIQSHEQNLMRYANQRLSAVEGLNLVGTSTGKAGVIAFTMKCAHPHDIATLIDHEGVAIRAGHHCAQPLHDFLGLPATTRASLGMYNNEGDIDRLADALDKVRGIFA